MLRWKRRLLWLVLLGCVAAGGIVVFFLLSRSAINRENFEKIEIGMTLAQVEAILGGPERDESTGPIIADMSSGDDDGTDGVWHFKVCWHWAQNDRDYRIWASNQVMIGVCLDADGHVASRGFLAVRRWQERPLDTLRRWLRL